MMIYKKMTLSILSGWSLGVVMLLFLWYFLGINGHDDDGDEERRPIMCGKIKAMKYRDDDDLFGMIMNEWVIKRYSEHNIFQSITIKST